MKNDQLRQVGLKITLPRIKILEILELSEANHLSAEDIYQTLHERDEDVGLATIYRVLTQFESAGLVRRHHFDDGQAKFELETGQHHDHLICVNCGKVIEFTDQVIEDSQNAIARENGFKITDHKMVLYGICNKKSCNR